MGKLNFRSADPDQGLVFKPEFLASAFPLKQGDIFGGRQDPQSSRQLQEALRRLRLHRFRGHSADGH